jgi:hypothetical protein
MLLDFGQNNKGNYHIKTIQFIRSVLNEFDIIIVNRVKICDLFLCYIISNENTKDAQYTYIYTMCLLV